VQPAEGHIGAAAPVVIRNRIRAPRRRDVDLNHHQIRLVVEVQALDVLVLNLDVPVGRQVPGESRQTEGRKE
jgi:hypothetical protein